MAPRRPIIITGFMGAGKTTVAAALARRLGCGHIDLDELIAEREGRTIREMFERDGESGFREAETRALRDTLENTEACVIALGGGAWTLERNRALIAEHEGYAVWLDVPFEVCWRRITRGGEVRPLAHDREKT
ncbi:MAG: AAA family ATPase, partial [Acidobacteria bacterium]|nr:AAA family ATPase [Acidobacteriota bacterium]